MGLVALVATAAILSPGTWPSVDRGDTVDPGQGRDPGGGAGAGTGDDLAERAPATVRAGLVDVTVPGFFSWALLDRSTGALAGSATMADVSSTQSMIKVWLVADHLRRAGSGPPESGAGPSAAELRDASDAIVHSDDPAAQRLYQAGQGDETIRRMIRICGLQDTFVGQSGWWSRTQMSARDAVTLGRCVADGRAAGPAWTPWVLERMRAVRGGPEPYDPDAGRGGGRWGIIDGLPAPLRSGVAIKNGWTRVADDPVDGPFRDGAWHVNCLAVHRSWILAVLIRYPDVMPLGYGVGVCASVARQLSGVPPGPTEVAMPAEPAMSH